MLTIFNKEIGELKKLIEDAGATECRNIDSVKAWPVSDSEELILKADMAMDLGGGEAFGISGILFTTDDTLISQNKVLLAGQDLQSLAKNGPDAEINYSRFVIIKLKEELINNKTSQQLYAIFRKLDYVRYHMFPEGFALRISMVQHREAVRISKSAVKDHIDFAAVGKAFIDAYMTIPEVEAVQLCFVASAAAGDDSKNIKKIDSEIFRKLNNLSRKSDEITESLNEIFKGLKMDCSTCSQKDLCDEIEGLKELHTKITN